MHHFESSSVVVVVVVVIVVRTSSNNGVVTWSIFVGGRIGVQTPHTRTSVFGNLVHLFVRVQFDTRPHKEEEADRAESLGIKKSRRNKYK